MIEQGSLVVGYYYSNKLFKTVQMKTIILQIIKRNMMVFY